MTEHKPLTTNELKANYGIVDGVPTYQDFYEAKDVLSAYKGMLSELFGSEDIDAAVKYAMEKWFPVFVEQKEGED